MMLELRLEIQLCYAFARHCEVILLRHNDVVLLRHNYVIYLFDVVTFFDNMYDPSLYYLSSNKRIT